MSESNQTDPGAAIAAQEQAQHAIRDFLRSLLESQDGAPPEERETHISIILLSGERAFKLKRALRLPYADFSTPQLRLAACEAELRLNRRTAPQLYRAVRRITRADDGSFEIDGAGALVDAMVEMTRFDEDGLFDRLAARGALTTPLLDDLADAIAAFHEEAEPVADPHGTQRIADVIALNQRSMADLPALPIEPVADLLRRQQAECARHAALLDARAAAGMIRRCHGDLHLRNICLHEGRPQLFDCIEFNETIATTDTLYDLAFLLMDLRARAGEDPALAKAAAHVANRYVDRSGDDAGWALLPLFMSMRATIRAIVAATQIAEGDADPALPGQMQAYLDLARNLLDPAPPRLVALGGFSGSGKTTIAEALAPRFGAPPGARILESDRLRKRMHGVAPETPLGPQAYTPEASQAVYAAMRERAAKVLAGGGSAILEAVHARHQDREAAAAIAGGAGCPFHAFWLDVDPAALQARIATRAQSASDATRAVLDAQLAKDAGPLDWDRLSPTGEGEAGITAQVEAIIAAIAAAPAGSAS
jgi:aminoglycoside phosphotransferase family enzyme/predicted kinase